MSNIAKLEKTKNYYYDGWYVGYNCLIKKVNPA